MSEMSAWWLRRTISGIREAMEEYLSAERVRSGM